ncbi:MAG: hypothetical protein ACLTEH_01650 [Clostridia bacterium]
MSELKAKAKNFKQSIMQNGIGTEIRRIKNYMKHKKTVLDSYAEWILLNEPDEKALEKQREYASCLNTKFAMIVPSKQAGEHIGSQTYGNYTINSLKPEDYSSFVKRYR